MEPTKAAYFAGHFDGEGCVDISCSANWNHARLQVTVGSCNLPILLEYRQAFGGNIYNHHKPVKGWRQAGKWILQRKVDVVRFLLCIEPFCVEKKAQVELCLNFLARHVDQKPTREELNNVHCTLRGMKKVSWDFSQFSKAGDAQNHSNPQLIKEQHHEGIG